MFWVVLVCVLFALREVRRRHAWSALHCLTVVFSRCHWLGVPWFGDGIMCTHRAQLCGEKSRAAPLAMPLPPPQTPYCEKSLGWALWACGSTAVLSARPTERHSVLGPAHSFHSLRGFVLWAKRATREMPNYTQATKTLGVKKLMLFKIKIKN